MTFDIYLPIDRYAVVRVVKAGYFVGLFTAAFVTAVHAFLLFH